MSIQQPMGISAAGLLALALSCLALFCLAWIAHAESGSSTRMQIAGYSYHDAVRLKLPAALSEISGLTLDPAGRLYGHDDELGIVYEIDYRAGRVLRRFALSGGVKADFEGIAWLDNHLYLTTSSGRLFRMQPGSAEAQVSYETFESGLNCEVESLTRDPTGQRLLAACKNRPGGKKAVHIHAWDPVTSRWSEEPEIRIKRSAFDQAFESVGLESPKKLQPTAMTITTSGHLLILAGLQDALLELSPSGVPLGAARLNTALHRQPEGIVMTPGGTLIIADEGDSKGSHTSKGTLSIYEPED